MTDTQQDDKPLATIQYAAPPGEPWHDGPGWYYWDDEYRDEGSVGAFATREECESHAAEAGYQLPLPAPPEAP